MSEVMNSIFDEKEELKIREFFSGFLVLFKGKRYKIVVFFYVRVGLNLEYYYG